MQATQVEAVLEEMQDIYDRLEEEAASIAEVIKYRGTRVLGIDKDGEQSQDFWDLSDPHEMALVELLTVIEEAEKTPRIQKLVIQLGFDGAEDQEQMDALNYDPEISFEQIDLWERS